MFFITLGLFFVADTVQMADANELEHSRANKNQEIGIAKDQHFKKYVLKISKSFARFCLSEM